MDTPADFLKTHYGRWRALSPADQHTWFEAGCSPAVYQLRSFPGYLKWRSPILEELDGRIAIWYRCMANLTVYLLKVSNS
jgi:hypothetical protein